MSFIHTFEEWALKVKEFIDANPGAILAIIGGVLVIAAPGFIARPLLGAGGFSSTGPVAGLMAARWQSVMGTVRAHGLFATLQSAAMGGYGAAIVSSILQGTGAAMLGTGCFWLGEKLIMARLPYVAMEQAMKTIADIAAAAGERKIAIE